MILGIFAGFTQTGGIQRISRHTAAVLDELASIYGQSCRLISINDSLTNCYFDVKGNRYIFRGFDRKKWKLVLSILCKTYQTYLLYFGHVRLAILGLFMRLLNPKLRYWVTIHGIEAWKPLPFLERLSLYGAYGVITPSEYTAKRLIEDRIFDASKIVVIPWAVDPRFVSTEVKQYKLSFPDQKKIILTVSRLVATEPGKGIEAVICALPVVLKEVPDAFYIIIGGGDLQPYLERLAKEINVHDKVRFLGEKSDDDLIEYYSKADVFAMPSCQEGFGMVFLEAMAFGKPVIGGDHGGTPEIIKDGVTGFLVKFGDVETLANRLVSLLQDEGLRKKIGDAGKQTVSEKYTFDHFCNRLREVLLK